MGYRLSMALLALGLVFHPLTAVSEGIRDFPDGWLLGPADLALILDQGRGTEDAAARRDSPAGKTNPRWGMWAGVGQGRLYDMDELPLTFLEGGMARHGVRLPWSVAASWERLGETFLVENSSQVRLRLGGNPRAGIRFRTRSWRVEGSGEDSANDMQLEGYYTFGLGSRATGRVELFLHPNPLPPWHGRGARRTVAAFKFIFAGAGVALRLDQRFDGAPVPALEVMARLSHRVAVGLRADPETGALGGNLAVGLGKVRWQSSHLVHPVLGPTHRFHLGVGDPEASVR